MSKTAVTKTLIALAARLLLPALLAWAPLAQAGLVTQTRGISSPGFLTLDEFDGSLGVLQSVAISFGASVSRTVPYTCTETVSCPFGNAVGVNLVLFTVGTISLVAFDQGGAGGTCGAGRTCTSTSFADIKGGDFADDAPTLELCTDTGSGPDTFVLQFTAGPPDGLSFQAEARVAYVYEDRAAVPEPSSLAGAALGLGLMALTATAHRRGGSGRKG